MLNQLNSDVAQVPSAYAHEFGARQQVLLVTVVAEVEHLVDAVQCGRQPPRQAAVQCYSKHIAHITSRVLLTTK